MSVQLQSIHHRSLARIGRRVLWPSNSSGTTRCKRVVSTRTLSLSDKSVFCAHCTPSSNTEYAGRPSFRARTYFRSAMAPTMPSDKVPVVSDNEKLSPPYTANLYISQKLQPSSCTSLNRSTLADIAYYHGSAVFRTERGRSSKR